MSILFELAKKHTKLFLALTLSALLLGMASFVFPYRFLIWYFADPQNRPIEFIFSSLVLLTGVCLCAASIAYLYLKRLKDTQDWLIDVLRSQGTKLSALSKVSPETDMTERNQTTSGLAWPWGAHHTALLGHLDAAARRFWLLYDPADRTTAPTNEMVADWLQSERGVSKDKARAIASMLRADGLPMGPRT